MSRQPWRGIKFSIFAGFDENDKDVYPTSSPFITEDEGHQYRCEETERWQNTAQRDEKIVWNVNAFAASSPSTIHRTRAVVGSFFCRLEIYGGSLKDAPRTHPSSQCVTILAYEINFSRLCLSCCCLSLRLSAVKWIRSAPKHFSGVYHRYSAWDTTPATQSTNKMRNKWRIARIFHGSSHAMPSRALSFHIFKPIMLVPNTFSSSPLSRFFVAGVRSHQMDFPVLGKVCSAKIGE